MYKIIGADQKEYGPVTAEQIQQWIRDGRVNAHTQARLEPDGNWQPLSAFPEFAGALQPGGAAPGPAAPAFISPLPGAGGSRDAALRAVKGPAICLIVMAALGIAFFLFVAIGNMLPPRPVPTNLPPEWQSFLQKAQSERGPYTGVMYLFFAAMDAVVLFGAIKMLKLQSRSLAMTACIIAMLPFTVFCCCVPGLAFGIWGLVVINKPEVRSHFT